MTYRSMAQIKAIESANKQRWVSVNPELTDKSGIYFLTRTDEDDIRYFYIGQAKHVLTRLAGHLTGYQHIDLSIKKRGLYDEDNPYGWKVGVIYYPVEELDQSEQYWIREYTKRGYQCRYNKTAGGQGEGKKKINEYKPAKGYRDGIRQGKKSLAKELKHIIDTHLVIELKKPTKTSKKALEKFNHLLDEETYKQEEGV